MHHAKPILLGGEFASNTIIICIIPLLCLISIDHRFIVSYVDANRHDVRDNQDLAV